MYVKLDNSNAPVEWPVSVSAIRNANPSTSFPANMSNVDVSKYGFAPFSYSDQPFLDAEYEVVAEVTPVLTEGIYIQTWEVNQKYTVEEKEAYIAEKQSLESASIPIMHRQYREDLLRETDYFALSDVTMTSEMASYRQALRDLPSHSNWPNLNEADWPTKP